MQRELIAPVPGSGTRASERWTVTRDQLGAVLGLKAVTVNKLVTEGMPKIQHGRYDLAECVQWYVETWRQRANDKAPSDTSERKRYDAARAEQAELSLGERRRELIPIDQVRSVLASAVAILVSRLDALPARVAGDLAVTETPGAIQAKLQGEVHGIRNDIGAALGDLAGVVARRRASKGAAGTNGRRVGRRKSGPAGG